MDFLSSNEVSNQLQDRCKREEIETEWRENNAIFTFEEIL